jgi:hypothetical protein
LRVFLAYGGNCGGNRFRGANSCRRKASNSHCGSQQNATSLRVHRFHFLALFFRLEH